MAGDGALKVEVQIKNYLAKDAITQMESQASKGRFVWISIPLNYLWWTRMNLNCMTRGSSCAPARLMIRSLHRPLDTLRSSAGAKGIARYSFQRYGMGLVR